MWEIILTKRRFLFSFSRHQRNSWLSPVTSFIALQYLPLKCQLSPEVIFTNSSRTLFAKCSQTYSYLLGKVGGGGGGRRASLLLPPPPYPAVHFTVHLYSSRTLFANCCWILPQVAEIPTNKLKRGRRKKSWPEEFVAEFCQKGPKTFLKEFPSVTKMINTQRQ